MEEDVYLAENIENIKYTTKKSAENKDNLHLPKDQHDKISQKSHPKMVQNSNPKMVQKVVK